MAIHVFISSIVCNMVSTISALNEGVSVVVCVQQEHIDAALTAKILDKCAQPVELFKMLPDSAIPTYEDEFLAAGYSRINEKSAGTGRTPFKHNPRCPAYWRGSDRRWG